MKNISKQVRNILVQKCIRMIVNKINKKNKPFMQFYFYLITMARHISQIQGTSRGLAPPTR